MKEKINESKALQLSGQTGRLDAVLVEIFDESRSTIQKLIKNQQILVNNKIEKANFKLTGQELIQINFYAEELPEELIPQEIPLDIVYEDEDLLVINKEAGMVVHPSKGHLEGTLVNGLLYYLDQNISQGSQFYRPGIVHRIDRDTSGLLVIAKNNHSHRFLSNQLIDHTMGREYIALVHGQINVPSGTIEIPLKRDPNNRLKWAANTEGKYALTEFEVLEVYENASLLKLELKTGRTHQIRVHLEYIGHPLVGDPVYRKGIQNFKGSLVSIHDGQLLHAKSLHFIHPKTKEMVTFSSPLPQRFESVLNSLS